VRVARQAIELGDDQLGTVGAAGFDCLLQFGPVSALAGLNPGERIDNLPLAAVEIRFDGRASRASRPRPDLPCLSVETR
jgi:hypothetical protein